MTGVNVHFMCKTGDHWWRDSWYPVGALEMRPCLRGCGKMDVRRRPALGDYLGTPVYENRNLPPRQLFTANGALYVRDTWDDLRLPLMIGDMRKAMQAHLADTVAAAAQRLGLKGDA